MGRAPCCSKVGLHRGPWTPREDTLLTRYIQTHGEGHWRSLPKKAGLLRCGKSCRLRWMNYLRPDIKRGNITPDEEDLIIRLHALLGNRWSLIAGRLPGRTDNEIKNYWNTHLSKRLRSQGTDPKTHKKLSEEAKKRKSNYKKKKSSTKFVAEQEKPKVHLPKPVRVSSMRRNESFNTVSSASFNSSNHGGAEADVQVPNWGTDVFLVGDHDHLVNGSEDLECQSASQVFTGENCSLQKLYEEYLQILKDQDDHHNLDSFAESLLL